MSTGRGRNAEAATFATVRELALALPETKEGTSYGTPAFFVRGKLFARQHQSGEALVVKIDLDERDVRMQADPQAYFITDHYLNYPLMLVRLSNVYRDDLRELLLESWRRSAPKRLLANFDAEC
jgi:hypothetical protein